MSMKKENVEEWNNAFADCQMKQSDLTQPTEGFLIKALVCYTRRFGYKVEPPFALNGENVENTRENRLFLIKMARQIDHFLKITDKSYAFTYYDLIRPTPKKTAHTLYILLNYLFYYNMYKEEVFKKANEPIQKYQEIKSLIERQHRENEKKSMEAKETKVAVDELLRELPCLRSEHKELSKKSSSREDEMKKLKETCAELDERLKHLHEQKRSLLKRVVSDEESRELQKQIENLKSDIAKHKEMESGNEGNLREINNMVEVMQRMMMEIDKAGEIVPMRLLEQSRETSKQLDKAKKDEHEAKEKQTLLVQQIEDETKNQQALEQKYQAKKQEFDTKQKIHKEALDKLQSDLKQKNAKVLQLQREEHASECQLEEQRDISTYIMEAITEILNPYEGDLL